MQQWKDDFDIILERSNIIEIMCGLYVDDGRNFIKILDLGNRFVEEKNLIEFSDEAFQEDTTRGVSKEDLTKEQI